MGMLPRELSRDIENIMKGVSSEEAFIAEAKKMLRKIPDKLLRVYHVLFELELMERGIDPEEKFN